MSMTGDELRKARRRLGLTQVALAELIGTTGNTVARWERSAVPITEVAARFIRHLVSCPARKAGRARKGGARP